MKANNVAKAKRKYVFKNRYAAKPHVIEANNSRKPKANNLKILDLSPYRKNNDSCKCLLNVSLL
jgi:hypothetical protein